MIKVSNVYYMLSYAFDNMEKLHQESLKKYQDKNFETLNDFYEILAILLLNKFKEQIKKGLKKDYVAVEEELSLIKGKIDINGSLKKKTYVKNKLNCIHDEYLINSYLNQIVKVTFLYLLKSNRIKSEYLKQETKKYLKYLEKVEEIKNPQRINWRGLNFNRNTKSYKNIMGICKLILKDLYLNEEEKGDLILKEYKKDRAMANLFETFIRKYYDQRTNYTVKKEDIKWKKLKNENKRIPKMETDISLISKNKHFIIDAKFYSKILSEHYDKEKFSSFNMYQIYSYVKNSESKNTVGMILYAKTEEENLGWNEFEIEGNTFVITDLDLGKSHIEIEEKLENIIKWYEGILTSQEMKRMYHE